MLLSGFAKCGVLVKLNASARNWMCKRSVTAKSRNNPKSQLKTPGPRRLLKPELPSDCRQLPGLFGSNTSANADGSYQNPERSPIFLGLPTMSISVGEFPGQPAQQSPVTLNVEPL